MPTTSPKQAPNIGAAALVPMVIIGGGVMGAISALVAAHMGQKVVWFGPKEAERPSRTDGADHRNYALAPLTVDLLKRLGVWPSVEANTCTVSRMEVFAGAERVDLSATDAGAEFLSIMLLHQDLLQALETATQFRPEITRHTVRPEAIHYHQDHAEISWAGQTIQAALVVGADGARSWVRQQAKILWGQKDYDQTGFVATFATEYPHASVAAQWFTPEGILALLPLKDPCRVSMVWSASPNKAVALDHDQLSQTITQLSARRFGQLTLVSEVSAAPLKMLVTESQTALRTVLIGDAGHTVHPLAGYGLNLGVQDLLALEAILRESSEDLGARSNIDRYEKARSQRVRRVQLGLDLLQRLVSEPHPAIARVRQLGMGLIANIGPLRQFLIRQAISPQ